jgi:hypothetical protein
MWRAGARGDGGGGATAGGGAARTPGCFRWPAPLSLCVPPILLSLLTSAYGGGVSVSSARAAKARVWGEGAEGVSSPDSPTRPLFSRRPQSPSPQSRRTARALAGATREMVLAASFIVWGRVCVCGGGESRRNRGERWGGFSFRSFYQTKHRDAPPLPYENRVTNAMPTHATATHGLRRSPEKGDRGDGSNGLFLMIALNPRLTLSLSLTAYLSGLPSKTGRESWGARGGTRVRE